MDETEQQLRIRVTEKIEEVEQAVESLQSIRKSLLQNAYETKKSILEAFINQRDSMQSREMVLLGKVDVLLQSKDDALVTQLSKLNQVLGCLRNCLQSEHPCGECLEKYDDLDLDPVAEMSIEFKSASDILSRAIDCYGQLSGDASAAPTTDEETGSPSVTQWLLTPTNVKRKATEKASAGANEIMSTEWLLGHHSTSPSTAITAGKLFTEVRGADRDCWLRPDTAAAHSSLYSHTPDSFAGAQDEAHHDWLLPEVGEAQLSSADSVHEEVASCASSSCVVIPSAMASECSSYVMANSWLQHAQLPPLSHHLPYGVNRWVASCQPAESGDWLVSSRQRLISTSSLSSDIHQLHLVEDHWLSGKEEPSLQYEEQPYKPEADSWLVSGESERVAENQLMSTELPEWLPIPKKLQLAQYDFGDEEKHDNAAEKHSRNSDWMTLSMAGAQQWLQKDTGSSDVGFADKRKAAMSRSADRDWLVVVNTLNQIAASDQSGWLVNHCE